MVITWENMTYQTTSLIYFVQKGWRSVIIIQCGCLSMTCLAEEKSQLSFQVMHCINAGGIFTHLYGSASKNRLLECPFWHGKLFTKLFCLLKDIAFAAIQCNFLSFRKVTLVAPCPICNPPLPCPGQSWKLLEEVTCWMTLKNFLSCPEA